jgi:hypothetical protein
VARVGPLATDGLGRCRQTTETDELQADEGRQSLRVRAVVYGGVLPFGVSALIMALRPTAERPVTTPGTAIRPPPDRVTAERKRLSANIPCRSIRGGVQLVPDD